MQPTNTELFEFGGYQLNVGDRTLTHDGKVISLAPKVFDTLAILVENHGKILSKQDLMSALWPDAFVEESNLTQNIYVLRRVLGRGSGNDGLIENVPRRGYRVACEVHVVNPSAPVDRGVEVPPSTSTPADSLRPKPSRFTSAVRWAVGLASAAVVIAAGVFFVTSNIKEPVRAAASAEPEAIQAYTRGKMILARRDSDNRPEKAIDEFQKAITIDPTFALAYAGLAEGFHAVARRENFPDSEDYNAKARSAADRSLELDPNLPEGHLISGWIKQTYWDWAGAEAGLRRAIQLNSKNAAAHQRLASLLSSLSRHDEALSEIRIAYALDPIADGVLVARIPILEAQRDYDAGLKESEKLFLENKNNTQTARAYATFLYHTGNYAKVIELGHDVLGSDANKAAFAWHSLMHGAYLKSAQPDLAEQHLRHIEAMAAKDTKAAYSLAMNYAEIGRLDESIRLLEDCYQRREERLMWINVEPRFENLRTHDRFQDLLRKLKFS
jgi:DNA-binding winged helix-turn-helix (wHTH) protein/tetratricopeptide (TPR) repeat protein